MNLHPDVEWTLEDNPLLVEDATAIAVPSGIPAVGTRPVAYGVPNPDTPRLGDNGSIEMPPHQSGAVNTLAEQPDATYAVIDVSVYGSS